MLITAHLMCVEENKYRNDKIEYVLNNMRFKSR